MKKVLLLFANLFAYEWNAENISEQLKYQKNIHKLNRDVVIRVNWIDTKYYCDRTEYYCYYKFLINKEFTKKYLSLCSAYNKVAKNYLKNKQEINEFFYSIEYILYTTTYILKILNTSFPILIFFNKKNQCNKFLKSKNDKLYLLLFSFMSNCLDVYCCWNWNNNKLIYGLYVDNLNFALNYEKFFLKFIAGLLNIYYYEQDRFIICTVAYTALIDLLHIGCIHKCNKILRMNKNKYIKLTKKEYKKFKAIEEYSLSLAPDYIYEHYEIVFDHRKNLIDKSRQRGGYMVSIDYSDYMEMLSLL